MQRSSAENASEVEQSFNDDHSISRQLGKLRRGLGLIRGSVADRGVACEPATSQE